MKTILLMQCPLQLQLLIISLFLPLVQIHALPIGSIKRVCDNKRVLQLSKEYKLGMTTSSSSSSSWNEHDKRRRRTFAAAAASSEDGVEDGETTVMDKVTSLNLEELLEELDRREVRYRATASKRQLQNLLVRHLLQSSSHPTPPSVAGGVGGGEGSRAHVRRPSRVTRTRIPTTRAQTHKRKRTHNNNNDDEEEEEDWSLQKAAMATLTLASDAALWTAKTTRKKYYHIRTFTDSKRPIYNYNNNTTTTNNNNANKNNKSVAYQAACRAFGKTRDLFFWSGGNGDNGNQWRRNKRRRGEKEEEVYNAKWQYVTKVDYTSSPSSSSSSSSTTSTTTTLNNFSTRLQPLPPATPQPFTTTHSTATIDSSTTSTTTQSNNGFVIRPSPRTTTTYSSHPPPINTTLSTSQKYVAIPYSTPVTAPTSPPPPPPSSSSSSSTSRTMHDRNAQNKTIYSPYNNLHQEEEDDDFFDNFNEIPFQKASRQILNALGTQIDNVIDLGTTTIHHDDKQDNNNNNNNNFNQKQQQKQQQQQHHHPPKKNVKKKQHRRYWRDRLSERFDKLLGLHEHGKYYNSWQTRLDEIERLQHRHDKKTSNNNYNTQKSSPQKRKRRVDAFDVARGVPLETQFEKQRRRTLEEDEFFKVPFWEQDGSLMNLLFGKRRGGKGKVTIKEIFQNDKMWQDNICTSLFKSLLRSIVILATYTFKWASVRGALPQPVIVFGVSTAAICAPRKRRIMTVGVTLVALRTLGEALHGYIYGREDWEDDYVYDYDDDGEEEEEENGEEEGEEVKKGGR